MREGLELLESLSIGKIATLMALGSDSDLKKIRKRAQEEGYIVYKGCVGSMDSAKIFAAIETAAKKEGIIKPLYREEHSIYHSILDAYAAICRGQAGLGNVLRTVGLAYSIVKGPRIPKEMNDGDWVAVVLYGNIGAPTKGYEHEVIGLGINPI